jgi:glycerate-2-kinase
MLRPPFGPHYSRGPGASRGVALSATLRADALVCHAAALAAVEPAPLVRRCLARDGDRIVLRERTGATIASHAGPVVLVGGGKAALGMARAAAAPLGDACRAGIVVVPHGTAGACAPGVDVLTAGHPVPDAAGAVATARLLALVERTPSDTLVLAVLSGGASALLVAPAAGVSLDDKQRLTSALLAAGADIGAFNAVRKHCSRLKGGGLARAARNAAGLWALVLSDVPGDDPAVVASGPASADPTTWSDVAAALSAYLRPTDVPATIEARVQRGLDGAEAETPKPGEATFTRVAHVVVGGNRDAVAAAAATAAARGYAVEVVAGPLVGDAADAGRALADRLVAAPAGRPCALIAGGETTARAVPGGRGGRCQHLALAAALRLAGRSCVLLAAGTDGVDGPTDAAGACIDGETIARAHALGLDPEAALAGTDSHTLLAATDDLVRTGASGTNVADVVVALRAAC